MLTIEKLRRVQVVYTHAHCPDGVASAMILQDAFRMLGMKPRIEFLVHNTTAHLCAGLTTEDGKSVVGPSLFCDIAPHVASVDTLRAAGGAIVLDHHSGTREIVEAFGEDGVYADAKTEPGVSGATLAFREVWERVWNGGPPNDHAVRNVLCGPRDPIADFAACSGARDCWVTSNPLFRRGQHMVKMLMAEPASYWLEPRAVWPDAATAGSSEDRHALPYLSKSEVEAGRVLFRAHLEAVRQAWNQRVVSWVPESPEHARGDRQSVYLVVFQENACGARLTSDVAEMVRRDLECPEERIVVASFTYILDRPGEQPKLSWSLRGINGFDVSAFARMNGGNGHEAAAGFSIGQGDSFALGASPYGWIQKELHRFLAPLDLRDS